MAQCNRFDSGFNFKIHSNLVFDLIQTLFLRPTLIDALEIILREDHVQPWGFVKYIFLIYFPASVCAAEGPGECGGVCQ